MTEEATTPEPAAEERQGLRGLVDRLAGAIDRALPGELAALRRLDPEDPSCPAFWKLACRYLESSDRPLGAAQERRWAVILSGMARTQGQHRAGRKAGDALAQVASEARFTKLLRASDRRLWDELRHVTHQLSSVAEPFDWGDLAELVLTDGGEHHERARRSLARDYYGALARAEAESK